MLVLIHGGERPAALDLGADVTWTSPLSGDFGTTTLTVPRESAAWAADVIPTDGGFLATVLTQFGPYRGVCDKPTWTPAGMTIIVHELSIWVSLRLVGVRTFVGCTAGMIFRRAVSDALLGHGSLPITLGPVLHAPPIIPLYEFTRQPLIDVLNDLHELSGQIWWLDSDLQINWGLRPGRFIERTLVDDGRLFGELQPGTLEAEEASLVEIQEDGLEIRLRGNAPLYWPKERLVRSSGSR